LRDVSGAEKVPFTDSDFPHEREQVVRDKLATIGAVCEHRFTARQGLAVAFIDNGTDNCSHGVSDPSGHVRGQ
jgi:hypothetical protein